VLLGDGATGEQDCRSSIRDLAGSLRQYRFSHGAKDESAHLRSVTRVGGTSLREDRLEFAQTLLRHAVPDAIVRVDSNFLLLARLRVRFHDLDRYDFRLELSFLLSFGGLLE
jgi:hypothetical protein